MIIESDGCICLVDHRAMVSGLRISTVRILLCFLLFIFVFAHVTGAQTESLLINGQEGKEPTCTESGYRVIEERGVTRFEELPPKGHLFSGWVINDEANMRIHICNVCGYEETIRISSVSEELLPRLEMNGSLEGISRKNKVALEVKYTDPNQSFQCYGLLTIQGHSTYDLPKKNYTIRFFDDAEGNSKHKVVFRNWNKEHKYILKANYDDVTQCRNIVGARIWTDIVKARESIPDRLSVLPTYGSVDGFPVAVYLNGDFFGLYTMNLHKDDDLYQMEKNNQEAVLICNEQRTDESLFKSEALFLPDNMSDWEIEFCGTEDQTWAKESFNELISFAIESDDLTFHEHLADYLDLDAAIDYLIFIYALGLKNSGAKDLVMLNYGDRWIPSAFDMDDAFGIIARNSDYKEPGRFLPSLSDGEWDSNTGSLLWDRIINAFTDRIIARYFELRKGAISEKNILRAVDDFISKIPESFYDYDWYLYPGRKETSEDMYQQIEHYIPLRLKILDAIFEGGENL